MGDTLGFLPGSLEEKMRPWLQPIYDALEVLMPPPGLTGEQHGHKRSKKHEKHIASDMPQHSAAPAVRKPYEQLIEQGIVEIEALCYIRGRSIPRRFFVLDEAQQLTPLEAKTSSPACREAQSSSWSATRARSTTPTWTAAATASFTRGTGSRAGDRRACLPE